MVVSVANVFSPSAVTIVGGSPRRGASVQILENLQRPDVPFQGPLHVINRSEQPVAGVSAVANVDDIPGPLGVVYMMLGAANSIRWLNELDGRMPEAVVCYSGGFAEVGNNADDHALRDWSDRMGVPVVGPQSLGVMHTGNGFAGLCLTLPEEVVPGPVAVLAQSGGMVGGSVRTLLQRGIGVAAAVSYGSASSLGFLDLARELVTDDTVKVILVHTESIPDLRELRALGRSAHMHGKPILLTLAGGSEAGRKAVVSHTASVATPRRIARGVCHQAGIIWVDDVDDLIDGAEALVHAGVPPRLDARVGVFAGSGGGAIAIADALASAGVALAPPSQITVDELRRLGVIAPVDNPFDAGAALLDAPENYAAQVEAFAADEGFGIVCKVIGSSAPSRAMPPQLAQYEDFVRQIQSMGKMPFLATPIAQQVIDPVRWEGTPWAAGARRVAVKLRVLQDWARHRAGDEHGDWWTQPSAPEPSVAREVDFALPPEVLTGPLAFPHIEQLPITIASSVLVTDDAEAEQLVKTFAGPLILKSETGLAHRAQSGAVIGPLRTDQEVRAGLTLLASRWGYPVSANDFVAHEAEFMVGVEHLEGFGVFCSAGPGGVGAGQELLLYSAPMSQADARRLGAHAMGPPIEPLAHLLMAMQELPAMVAGFRSLEFNPITLGPEGQLVALDVKLVRETVTDEEADVREDAR